MTYRIEYLNDHGDWILSEWISGAKKADMAAEERHDSGYSVRVILEGKIVRTID
jgi:hypothetical protein